MNFKPKHCKICGKIFIPTSRSQTICTNDHYQPCPVCGKPVLWNHTTPVPVCSKECKNIRRKQKCMEKYGVEHPMQLKSIQQKQQQSLEHHYGVTSPLQNEEIKQKAIESNRQKFGTDWALGSKEVHKQIQQTMLSKYGGETTLESEVLTAKVNETVQQRYGADSVAHINRNEKVNAKRKQTNINRYGVENPAQNNNIQQKRRNNWKDHKDEILDKIRETNLGKYGVDNPPKDSKIAQKITSTMMSRYGVNCAMKVPEFYEKYKQTLKEHHKYGPQVSLINLKFKGLLENNGFTVELEKLIDDKFYDLYLPKIKTVIEIDPTISHNLVFNPWGGKPVDKYYHRDKTNIAVKNSLRCIHVFDWDDWNSIIHLLLPTTRIYARKCTIQEVNKKDTEEFLNKYHLQKSCTGQTIRVGLYFNNELVELITFGKPRFTKKYSWELLRLCTKEGYTVVGGASRLFKYCVNIYNLNNIISYCNYSKFTGKVYEQMGMSFVKYSTVNVVWNNGSTEYITDNLLRQQGFDRLFNTNYGKGTDNKELMVEHKWYPVPDCGQKVFEYTE